LGEGHWDPIKHKVARAEAYLHTKRHLDLCSHLAATDMCRKLGGGLCPFRAGVAGSPPNTMRPGPRPTCMPCFILIRPTVWPQCMNVTDGQTGQERQRTDSIGRTVLQTVAQKQFALCYRSIVCLCCMCVTFVHCGQTVGRIKTKVGTQVGVSPGHIVLDGNPAPLPQKGTAPQFSAHICCGQMAAWIKMPLGMELGLGPGDFVLNGDPARPSPKGRRSPPNFQPMFIAAKRLDG